MSKLKSESTETIYLWNDDYEVALTFRKKVTEPPIEPEPIVIPTSIQVRVLETAVDIKIPTDINIKQTS